jgi:hypothetical protein
MDILIKVAYNDWMAWAKLALADPTFCAWAAQLEQIAAFMRTFYIGRPFLLHTMYYLDGQQCAYSWFNYPTFTTGHGFEKKIYGDGLPCSMTIGYRCWKSNKVPDITNYSDNILYADSSTEPVGYSNNSITYKHYTFNSNGSRSFYGESIIFIGSDGAPVM